MRLHVTTTDIEKFWRPRFLAVGGLREFAPNRAAPSGAHRRLIGRTLVIEKFRWNEPHFAARRPNHGYFRYVRGILAKIENDITVGEIMRGNRLVNFKFADRR